MLAINSKFHRDRGTHIITVEIGIREMNRVHSGIPIVFEITDKNGLIVAELKGTSAHDARNSSESPSFQPPAPNMETEGQEAIHTEELLSLFNFLRDMHPATRDAFALLGHEAKIAYIVQQTNLLREVVASALKA